MVQLQSNFVDFYNNSYTVKIYNTALASSPALNISINKLELNSHSDPSDILDTHILAGCKLSIFIESEYLLDFAKDVGISPANKYFLEVLKGPTRIFMGSILSNGSSYADQYLSIFTIEAVDGFSLLKSKEYNTLIETASISEILTDAIALIPAVDKFYTATDKVIVLSSNIKQNVFPAAYFFEVVRSRNYYYTQNNGAPKYMSHYDVVIEICKKLNLRLTYINGLYYFIGNETDIEGHIVGFKAYRKNRQPVTHLNNTSTYDITHETLDTLVALDGGTFNHKQGYKKVTIIAQSGQLNKNLASKYKWFNFQNIDIARLIQAKQYKMYLTLTTQPIPTTETDMYIRIRIKLKFTPETGAVRYGYTNGVTTTSQLVPQQINENTADAWIILEYPFSAGSSQVMKFLLPTFANDAMFVAMQTEFVEFRKNGVTYVPPPSFIYSWSMTMFLGINTNENTGQLEFVSTNDTENILNYKREIVASDSLSNDESQYVLRDGANGNYIQSQDNYFYGTDAPEYLENTIVRKMLTLITNNQEQWQGSLHYKDGLLNLLGTYNYRGNQYKISSYNVDVEGCTTSVTLKKIGVAPVNPVITIEVPIPSDPYIPPTSNLNTTNQNNLYYARFTGSGLTIQVTDITFPNNLLATYTNNSINNAIKVYVSGVKYFVNNAGTLQYNDNWILNESTKTFTFKKDLTGLRIEVEIDLSRLQTSIIS
jgi:hypothetical protein